MIRIEQGRFVVRTNDGTKVIARFDTHEEATKFNQRNFKQNIRERPKGK